MTETDSRPRNRALVASFLFTDIVGYSKGTASEQYAAKAALSEILRRNLAAVSKDDYRIKDTGDGALISFLVNPEHALYMALAIAHDFGHPANASGLPSSRVRTGLHIGAVKEAIDLEARPNFVGDGINAAQRVMDLAAPGQVTASRAYVEAVSWLDASYGALFQHLGESNDKHGRAHDLYAVTPSDAVLEKLRADLDGAAQDARATDDAAVAAAAPKRADRSTTSTGGDSSAASAKSAAERKWLVPVAVLLGIAIISGVAFVAMSPNTTGLASRSAESKSGAPTPAATTPAAATPAAAAPAATTPAATAPATASTVQPQLKIDPAIANRNASDVNVTSSSATKTTPSPASNAMNAATGPASASSAAKRASSSPAGGPVSSSASSAASASAVPATPSAPASATAPAGARCRHILEKVQVGEPLSQDEKRELANSCR